jgi:hypothetical protein
MAKFLGGRIMTGTGPVNRHEIEEIKDQLAETQKLVKELHDALMVAQPGQDKSLLERMAAVTIGVESGTRTVRFVLILLALCAALGISFRFGIDLRGAGE